MIDNNQKKIRGLKHIWQATLYSLDGIKTAFITEAAFRQEVIITSISIPLALMIPLSFVFKAFLIASTIGVLIAELVNTALESIVNIVSQGFHPLGKRAKDMASAAVMLSIINLGVAWLFALLQFLLK
ncbi:MAG: diacylglycerol kinase [Pseudomonadota bacterium]